MKEKISLIAILANAILAVAKITAGFLSHSAAILAEGLHSFMDIFSSAVSYIGIRISKKPSDQKHPYGHYKFEVLAGTIITIILLATGLGIIYGAYQSFLDPGKIKISYLSFGIMIFSAVVNEIMARLKIHYGKKENSISLLSDGLHSRVDVYASLGVLAGLILTKYWLYADSIIAFLIGLYIIKESLALGKEAIDSLLDVSAPKEIEDKIYSVGKGKGIKISNLKTQKKGSAITVNLQINLDRHLKVEEAEIISNNLREELMRQIENISYVAIQIKSHEVETGFYKPEFGKAFGWQKRGRFKGRVEYAKGGGPGDYCVCLKCNYKIPHKRGIPCPTLECPKCKIKLVRE